MDDKNVKHDKEDGYKVIKHAVDKMSKDLAKGKHITDDKENDGGGYQF